jgi:prepilin-type N-terminal cleavage/methylation domain-containing protein
MHNVLKSRQGFTLAEVLVALTMTAVIGAAVTGVFISQSKFFDHQEKVGFARGVTRGATNMIMSELRMLEIDQGIMEATNTKITARVPIGMGVICRVGGGGLTVSRLPSDQSIVGENGYYGFAYRRADGTYDYRDEAQKPSGGNSSYCAGAGVRLVAGSYVQRLNYSDAGQPPADTGAVVLLYAKVTYEFKASDAVPGRIGLWRHVESGNPGAEELVAPFDTTAKFRFYENDQPDAQDAVPGVLGDITGLELVLDGLSQRPNSDGSHQSVPSTTSVFFKNRP